MMPLSTIRLSMKPKIKNSRLLPVLIAARPTPPVTKMNALPSRVVRK
jgi:hypothetical protein